MDPRPRRPPRPGPRPPDGKTLPALRHALPGRFRAHQAFLVSQVLAHLDYRDEAIETVSGQLDTPMTPCADDRARLVATGPFTRWTARAIASRSNPQPERGVRQRGMF